MKKIYAFINLCLLAGCSLGGSSSDYQAIQVQTTTSNNQITGMDTRVIVDGKTVKLSDAELYALFDDNGTDNHAIKFIVNNSGQIKKIIVSDIELNTKTAPGGAAYDIIAARVGNTNSFAVVNDKDTSIYGDITYNSIGKEIGLQYADFGTLQVDIENTFDKTTIENVAFFTGGYDVKKLNPNDNDTDTKLEFTGKAIGRVTATSNTDNKINTILLSGDAKLVFDNGIEKTTTHFDNWYDVNIEKAQNATPVVTLNNYSPENPSGTDEMYGMKTPLVTQYDINYYGDDIPSEAVGIVGFKDKNVNAVIGFGVK
ncbi:MAG: hypothetical protein NC311_02850 [Muribaculaceae bacterium]|nr:hypothetical protein [Muribaculaceae bacterium]